MELSSVSKQCISAYSRFLWEFTQNLSQGDVNCINGSNEKKILEAFYKLIKAFSQEKTPIGYLVHRKQYGKQNLYLRYDYVSQSKPLSTLEEIDYEIKRMVTHYEKPIIFIKDFFKISIGTNYWQKSKNKEFKEATEKLKVIAKKHKVIIYTFMLFDSEDILKQYYLHFGIKGNGLIRKKTEKHYFSKQFCLNSSKDSSYKARQKLHRQIILEHQGLKPIEKHVGIH